MNHRQQQEANDYKQREGETRRKVKKAEQLAAQVATAIRIAKAKELWDAACQFDIQETEARIYQAYRLASDTRLNRLADILEKQPKQANNGKQSQQSAAKPLKAATKRIERNAAYSPYVLCGR